MANSIRSKYSTNVHQQFIESYDQIIIEENVTTEQEATKPEKNYFAYISKANNDKTTAVLPMERSHSKQNNEPILADNQPSYVIVVNPDQVVEQQESSQIYFYDSENTNEIITESIQYTDQLIITDEQAISEQDDVKLIEENRFYEIKNYDDLIIEDPTDNDEEFRTARKMYVCLEPGCGKKYATKINLQVHTRTHTGIKPFECDICGQLFNTSYARVTHIRTHTGERPYKCTMEDCKKAFKTSGDLGKHIRTHTGDRPFKCLVGGCDMYFTTTTVRKVHMRTHSDERPFACTFENCRKTFRSLSNYNNHGRIHRGERPYRCSICDKTFTEYSSLFKHRLVHNPLQVFGCPVCGREYRKAHSVRAHIGKNHPNHLMEIVDHDDTNKVENSTF